MNVFSVKTKVNGLLSQTEKYPMKSEFYCNNLCLYLILCWRDWDLNHNQTQTLYKM